MFTLRSNKPRKTNYFPSCGLKWLSSDSKGFLLCDPFNDANDPPDHVTLENKLQQGMNIVSHDGRFLVQISSFFSQRYFVNHKLTSQKSDASISAVDALAKIN